jgi:hypothetical protein
MIPLVASTAWQRGLGPVPGAAWLVCGLVLLLPVIQLIPLPPSIWQAFPGRAIEVQSLKVALADQSWMPMSMAPARTFASLLAMICPVLLLLQVSRLSEPGRNWICATVAGVGGISLLLGMLQLSHTGGLEWSLYSQFSTGFLVGFQANRNAEADLLLIAMLAFGALVTVRFADRAHHGITMTSLLLGLAAFLVGVFMTGSRTGIALSLLALGFLAVMIWPTLRRPAAALRWLAGVLGALGIAGALLLQLPSVQRITARFSVTTEARWDIWADTWFAIHQVWPIGSGIGTIVPMLEAAERLEVVDPTRPVRAHNDWLEWVLEGGLPGIILLALILIVVISLVIRAIARIRHAGGAATSRHAHIVLACSILLIEGLHAIVDYPMRSMSLAALVAMAIALLLEPAAPQQSKA